MKKMLVLGTELKDYSVRESMRMVDAFLQDAKVNTVSFLTMDVLMNAAEDEDLRTYLSSMDLCVPVSVEILQAAGIGGRGRLAEVEEGRFYTELMKKLSEERRSAFLLTQKESSVEEITQDLKEIAPGLTITGSYAYENLTGDQDVIVNEINSTFSDVVLSALPTPLQEQFAYENKTKLNARMWVSVREGCIRQDQKKPSALERLRQWIQKKLFRRTVLRFSDEQDHKGENS
ncbi:MAG: WecB/TagA/CpsF family glycosyltransferase [Lachnospiraceae bacterium]|nr:WecB/TagA/CpsF family glycosyltransferase [Lachnospiraceae bacterium]